MYQLSFWSSNFRFIKLGFEENSNFHCLVLLTKVISKDGRAKMLFVRFYLKLHWAALENIIFDKKHIKLEKSSISWRGVLVWIKIWTFLFRIIRLVLVAFRLYSKFTSRVWYCPLRWTVDRHTHLSKKGHQYQAQLSKIKAFHANWDDGLTSRGLEMWE